MNKDTPLNILLKCKDGFTVSMAANEHAYCNPRVNNDTFKLGEGYSQVELGYPSKPDILIQDYIEGLIANDGPTQSIYPYVPILLVKELIMKHGGLVDKLHIPFKFDQTADDYQPEWLLLDVDEGSIEDHLIEFITEFGGEIEDSSFDYAGTHCTHGQSGTETVLEYKSNIKTTVHYKIMFEHKTPLDELPKLGLWKLPMPFEDKNEDTYLENVEVFLAMTYLRIEKTYSKGTHTYFTKLHIEIETA